MSRRARWSTLGLAGLAALAATVTPTTMAATAGAAKGEAHAPRAPRFPTAADHWIGAPVTWESLRGRVVLLDVWTFG